MRDHQNDRPSSEPAVVPSKNPKMVERKVKLISVQASPVVKKMVSVLAIAPGGTLRVARSKNPRLLIAIGDVAGPSTLACGIPGEALSTPLRLRSGQGLVPSPLADCAIRNGGRAAMRWVAIDFKGEMR